MRTFAASTLLLALSFVSVISAEGSHGIDAKRAHVRRQKAWGRRDLTTSAASATGTDSSTPTATAAATSLPSVVPDNVTGAITISNTAAAAPEATAAAVGVDRGDTTPLPACEARASFGSYCDPTSTDCCETGTTCLSNKCQRLCGINTTEAYCDANYPCDTTMGYVCTGSRCRPPATATRVAVGAVCDQGAANTLFCIPAKGICTGGICQPCTQHS